MKANRKFMSVILVLFSSCLLTTAEQARLCIKNTADEINVICEIPSQPGNFSLEYCSELNRNWQVAVGEIFGSGTNTYTFPANESSKFFRIMKLPEAGVKILLSGTNEYSGEISIPFVYWGNGIRSAILEDKVSEDRTNILSVVTVLIPNHTNWFKVDTKTIAYGLHKLRARVNTAGTNIYNDGSSELYSDSHAIITTNLLSLDRFGKTEWKFVINLSTPFSNGVWEVQTFTNGVKWLHWNGDLNIPRDKYGRIHLEDDIVGPNEAGIYEGYKFEDVKVLVTVTPSEGVPISVNTTSKVVQRPAFLQTFVGAEISENGYVPQSLAGTILNYMSSIADPFGLEGILPDWSYNNIIGSNWTKFVNYIENGSGTNFPTHIYVWSTNYILSIPSNSLSFVLLDGANHSTIELSTILGQPDKMSKEEWLAEGKFPAFGMTFSEANFSEINNNLSDIDNPNWSFRDKFFTKTFLQWPQLTYGQAIEESLSEISIEFGPQISSKIRNSLREIGIRDFFVYQ